MRKNYTFVANVATSRNDLIDLLTKKECAIVLTSELVSELEKEIKTVQRSRKYGKFLTTISIPMMLLSVGWIPIILFGTGALTRIANDDFKKYKIYFGENVKGERIMVFHRKSEVNLSYDTVTYPEWVLNVKDGKKKIHEKL